MRVHQILASLEAGDAVSNQALAIHRLLAGWGFEPRLYAHNMDEFAKARAERDEGYRPFMHQAEDLLIFHYSIYCDNYRLFLESRNRKVLVYHNITPAEYYRGFSSHLEELCRAGREILPLFSSGCDLALGDSDFNRRELVEAGFPEERTGVLPIHPPLGRLEAVEEDRSLRDLLEDGKVNFLYVGRVVPNKRVDDLIRFFSCYYRGVDSRARLVLAGLPIGSYLSVLLDLVDDLGLEGRVLFLGKVSDAALKACYLHSHYYLSMSEHEGFCVPLLESFHFGLPVLAYAAGAVPETMGGAGILFDRKDFPLLAELVNRLQRDPLLRERIVQAQRKRLEDFAPGVFAARLREALRRVLGEPAEERAEKEGVS